MASEAWVDTVRLARDLGTVSGLLPDGVRALRDIPWQLAQAIKAALIFLGFEELPRDDVPARSIWLDTDRLGEHFDAIRNREPGERPGRGGGKRNGALDMLIAE